jgi:hypothetical protein
MEFIAESVVTAKGVANRAKMNQLDASQESEVSVVNKFPDVFPEELPGMPPDHDIEFVIGLKPGTFLMSSLRSCQVCHLTMTLSL